MTKPTCPHEFGMPCPEFETVEHVENEDGLMTHRLPAEEQDSEPEQ